MSAPSFDRAELLRVMPVAVIGEVSAIMPIRMGLSGAGVYGVTTRSSREDFERAVVSHPFFVLESR